MPGMSKSKSSLTSASSIRATPYPNWPRCAAAPCSWPSIDDQTAERAVPAAREAIGLGVAGPFLTPKTSGSTCRPRVSTGRAGTPTRPNRPLGLRRVGDADYLKSWTIWSGFIDDRQRCVPVRNRGVQMPRRVQVPRLGHGVGAGAYIDVLVHESPE